MHADRHHRRALLALGVHDVEGVAQVLEELVAVREALRQREAHVVGVEGVGHDEVRHGVAVGLLHLGPERQVVAVVVRVVQEAAVVRHQAAGVGRVAAGVPAQRALAGETLDELHADLHVLALDLLGRVLVVDPAPAVAGDLVAELLERGGELGVALERHRHAEDGHRQAAALELAQEAPHAHARAVLVDALHRQVAVGVAGGVEELGEELLAAGIAVQHAVLAAFLVVEHELHRDAGAAGPVRVRRVAAVADEVAGVGRVRGHGRAPRDQAPAPNSASRRKRAILPISFRQVRNSASRALASRASTRSMIWCRVRPLTATTKGKPKRAR